MKNTNVLINSESRVSCFNVLNPKAIYRSSEKMSDWELSIRGPLYIEIKPLYRLRTSELLEKPLAALLLRIDEEHETSQNFSRFFAEIRP